MRPWLAGVFCLVFSAGGLAETTDLYSDTWVATDALGRTQPDLAGARPVQVGKWVGIFYWTWHRGSAGGPNDNTKLIGDAAPGTPIAWPENDAPYHWGEPELGYYVMTDPFVIRKHASMLVDAGIDVVLFDTTNPPHTFREQYEALCKTYMEMRAEGARTPAIGFITPFWDPMPVAEILWKDLYQPGLWKDLWFEWEGKPLLLANKEKVTIPEMLPFFTYRRNMPDYWLGPSGPEQWSWLEVFPQHVFLNSKGEAEQMSVGVAQNALPNTPGPAPMSHRSGAMGRSWHGGKKDERPGAVDLGLNFDEQWGRALEVDPNFAFVTGWNEWIAGRYPEWSRYKESECYYPGGLFVDQYTQEYSRDCEPMRGGHTDNYYYQLASWVRRYKGVRERPKATGPSAIAVDGQFADWTSVTPVYRDTPGDVAHRDHKGYGQLHYTNDTGRNDFVTLKCGYDESKLYFYAATRGAISSPSDPHWMLLLIDADQDAGTGWLGYDFVVNNELGEAGVSRVQRWEAGAWKTVGDAAVHVQGNELELGFARALLPARGEAPAFDFHWADNIQGFNGVDELGVNGDSAPNRRWNYRFETATGK